MGIKNGLLAFGVVSLLIAAGGCGQSEDDIHKEAILRVLQNDKNLSATMNGAAQSATSLAEKVTLVDKYCAGLEQYDMSDCPPEFRLAFRQHILAWKAVARKLRELPDGAWEGLLVGFLNGFSGEADGGGRRIKAEIQNVEQSVKETYQEAERIGAKYGAVL